MMNPADGLARHQRGRPARRLRVRRDLHLARRAQRARQHRAGHDRARGGAADRHERPAAIGAPDADGGQARLLRPAKPEPRRHPARRSGHRGLWRAWRRSMPAPASWSRSAAELPAEIGDYVEKLVAPYFSAVVDWYETIGIGVAGRRAVERRARSHRRSVLRRLAQPRPSHPHRRVDAFAGVFRLGNPAAPPAWRCRSTSFRRPARRSSPPTSRTASRSPTRRCARRSPQTIRRPGRASRRGAPS